MDLELKHLAPYLPYELKIKFDEDDSVFELNEITINKYNPDYDDNIDVNGVINDTHWKTQDIGTVKPILNALTPIQNFVVLTTDECLLVSKGLSHNIPKWKFEILVENHFDVFGLIDAGLAIDINTI